MCGQQAVTDHTSLCFTVCACITLPHATKHGDNEPQKGGHLQRGSPCQGMSETVVETIHDWESYLDRKPGPAWLVYPGVPQTWSQTRQQQQGRQPALATSWSWQTKHMAVLAPTRAFVNFHHHHHQQHRAENRLVRILFAPTIIR